MSADKKKSDGRHVGSFYQSNLSASVSVNRPRYVVRWGYVCTDSWNYCVACTAVYGCDVRRRSKAVQRSVLAAWICLREK